MARSVQTLDRLPLVDKESGDFTVVLETPKGSRNKYRYDAQCQAIRLSATLGEGLAFPYDFGFIPRTKAEDGDPTDVSVDAARLSGQLFSEVRAAERPCAKYQQ